MSVRLGPVATLGHHLRLLPQQGVRQLLRLPGLLLLLLLLLVSFPCLQLALCNLDFQLLLPGRLLFFTPLLLPASRLPRLLQTANELLPVL